MSQQLAQDAAVVGMKAAPGAAVIATGATGVVNWSDIAYMMTALYMLAQIILLAPQYIKIIRGWRKKEKDDCE